MHIFIILTRTTGLLSVLELKHMPHVVSSLVSLFDVLLYLLVIKKTHSDCLLI